MTTALSSAAANPARLPLRRALTAMARTPTQIVPTPSQAGVDSVSDRRRLLASATSSGAVPRING